MKIEIKHIYISDGHNYFGRYGKDSLNHVTTETEKVELVAGKGIVGDRFFDFKEDYKGQITFFDWAVYEEVKEKVVKGELDPSAFRRNVIVSGVDLNELFDKHFEIDGVEFTGAGECAPCLWMNEACADGAEEFLKGRGGLRARILTDGELFTGQSELRVLGNNE